MGRRQQIRRDAIAEYVSRGGDETRARQLPELCGPSIRQGSNDEKLPGQRGEAQPAQEEKVTLNLWLILGIWILVDLWFAFWMIPPNNKGQ